MDDQDSLELLKNLQNIGPESEATSGASRLSSLLESNPKILSALKVGGKIMAPLATVAEGTQTKKDIDKGDYLNAAGSAANTLSGAAGTAAAFGMGAATPVSLAAGAAGLGIKGGAELGKQQAMMVDQGISPEGFQIPTKDELISSTGNNSLPPDLQKLVVNSSSVPDKNNLSDLSIQQITPTKEDETEEDQSTSKDLARSMVGLGDQSSSKALQAALQASQGQQSSFMDRLKAAQQAQSGAQLLANMNQAFSTVGRGIAGLGGKTGMASDQTSQFTQNLLKQAEQPVDQFKTQTEMQKYDPNSTASQSYKAFLIPTLKKLGIDPSLIQNASAADLEKTFPVVEKMQMMQENAKNRALQQQALEAFREKTLGLKEKSITNTQINRLNNRFNNETKPIIQNVTGVQKVESLLNDIKSGKLVDGPTISATLTSEMSALTLPTGVRGTMADRAKTAFHTLQGNLAQLQQYAGKPASAIPQQLLQQLEAEKNALKGSIVNILKDRHNSLEAGEPTEDGKKLLNSRFQPFYNTLNPSPHGDVVHQDGKTYQWNAKDSKYDEVKE